MGDREAVVAEHPGAYVTPHLMPGMSGPVDPREPAYFAVRSYRGDGAVELGRGGTEPEAWAAAAEAVRRKRGG